MLLFWLELEQQQTFAAAIRSGLGLIKIVSMDVFGD
jgi:hypothetical protein